MKGEKGSVPVDARRSKTSLLKLPIVSLEGWGEEKLKSARGTMGRRKRGLFSLLIVHTVCLVYFPLFVFYWNTQCDPYTGDWSHFLHTLAQYVKSFRY